MNVAAAIFGISEYSDDILNSGPNKLYYAAADAVSFERYVRAAWAAASRLTIECRTDRAATSTEWSTSIERLSTFKPDLFIAYLAGHAVLADEDNAVFCFADAHDGSGVLTSEELDLGLASIGAGTSILFLDCCHAEALVAGMRFFRRLDGRRARLFLCSARTDQKAWEDAAIQHGLFSNALIRGLADTSPLLSVDGYVGIEDLFVFVSEDVSKRAFADKNQARQEPVRGGVSAYGPRLPAASHASLGDQISTYDALATTVRRWLARATVLLVVFIVVTDLTFQHLLVNADGDIVARSGLRIFDPLRRTLPGGIVDTGFDRSDLNQSEGEDNVAFNALKTGSLVAYRLHTSSAWPAKLRPLLAKKARRALAIFLHAFPDADTDPYDPTFDPPPIAEHLAVLALRHTKDRNAAAAFVYKLPDFDRECDEDVTNKRDFSQLNPSTSRFLKELDWRLVSAGDFRESLRIVAYRYFVRGRELSSGNPVTTYDGVREFKRLAEWARAPQFRTVLRSIEHPQSWCGVGEALVVALNDDPDVAGFAETALLKRLEEQVREVSGDLLGADAQMALSLLAIVANHRTLKDRTVDRVSRFLREDERGLNGRQDFVEWLTAIAPLMPFPKTTRVFLFETLSAPPKEHDFRQTTAFGILARNAQHLADADRALVASWGEDNRNEFHTFDSYANGIAYLAPFLSEEFVQNYLSSVVTRADPARAIAPPQRSWRGDLLITQTHIPEWFAISKIAQHRLLPKRLASQLLTFAAVVAPRDVRREALLAVAYQRDVIRTNDWQGFRRTLIRLSPDGRKRDLLAEAAGLHICGQTPGDREAQLSTVSNIWSKEPVPILRIGLAKTLQHATLCTLTN